MYRVYPRVSSKGQSHAAQTPDLAAYASAKAAAGEQVQIYPAETFTGRTLDRPVWTRLESELRKGDVVVVWRLDRLGRSARGLINLLDTLAERGIGFVSIRDGIDTTAGLSPTTRLLLNLLSSIAQFETEIRADRVAAGIAAKRARGEKWTGGRRKGSAHKLQPATVATIRTLRDEGNTVTHIAKLLKLARGTVYAALAPQTT